MGSFKALFTSSIFRRNIQCPEGQDDYTYNFISKGIPVTLKSYKHYEMNKYSILAGGIGDIIKKNTETEFQELFQKPSTLFERKTVYASDIYVSYSINGVPKRWRLTIIRDYDVMGSRPASLSQQIRTHIGRNCDIDHSFDTSSNSTYLLHSFSFPNFSLIVSPTTKSPSNSEIFYQDIDVLDLYQQLIDQPLLHESVCTLEFWDLSRFHPTRKRCEGPLNICTLRNPGVTSASQIIQGVYNCYKNGRALEFNVIDTHKDDEKK